MRISLSSCFILFLSLSTNINANDYQPEIDFFGSSPVILTASRMHKPLRITPASVSVIDRQMIQDSGATEVADVLRMVPGFLVGNQHAHSPAVTYHGLGSFWHKRMQVLVDGRSVFIPSFGGVPWSNLPLMLQDIERIEVTRGPNAATYGSNAFLATINIITRNAAEDYGQFLSGFNDLDSDSLNRGLYFRTANQLDDFDWRLSMGRKNDGYADAHDSKVIENLNFRSDFMTSSDSFWSFQAGLNRSLLYRGNGDPGDIFREEDSWYGFQSLQWEGTGDRATSTFRITHTRQDIDDHFISDPINAALDALEEFDISPYSWSMIDDILVDVNFDRMSDRTEIEWFQDRSLTEDLSIVYGFGLGKDTVISFYGFNDNQRHHLYTQQWFGSAEYQLSDDWNLDFGLLFEDTNFTDPEASGRFSIIYQLTPDHHIRLVNSRAKRNPVLTETEGETVYVYQFPENTGFPLEGNIPFTFFRSQPNLQPETINAYELGWFSSWLDKQLNLDFKLFRYRLTEQIAVTKVDDINPDSGLPERFDTATNEGTTRVSGVEGSINFSPSKLPFRLFSGFSYLARKSFERSSLRSIPETTLYLGGHYRINPSNLFSGVYYEVSPFSWDYTADRLPRYRKLDLKYQLTLKQDTETTIELIATNLLGTYSNFYLDEEQERSMLIRFNTRF